MGAALIYPAVVVGVAAGGAGVAVGCGAAGERPCAFDDQKLLPADLDDPNFQTTRALDGILVQMQFKDVKFSECAIWGRNLEKIGAQSHVFLARAHHLELGEVLFSSQFMTDGKSNLVRLSLAYGDKRVRSMGLFICKVRENARVFQVMPMPKRDIMKGYCSSSKDYTMGDAPTWTRMKGSFTLNELKDKANNNKVSKAEYNFHSNNCQHFARFMYDDCFRN